MKIVEILIRGIEYSISQSELKDISRCSGTTTEIINSTKCN